MSNQHPRTVYGTSAIPQSANVISHGSPHPIIFHNGNHIVFHDGSRIGFHDLFQADLNFGKFSMPRTIYSGEAEL